MERNLQARASSDLMWHVTVTDLQRKESLLRLDSLDSTPSRFGSRPSTAFRTRHSDIVIVYFFPLVFLADHTNGHTYATVLCLSVCNVCIVAKR